VAAITDRAALDLWQTEYRQIDALLRRVEDVERGILKALRLPTDPVAVDSIVAGKTKPPWSGRKRTSARYRQRAIHAMHTLVWISQVRQHLGLESENARLAAHAALMAGLYANDAAFHIAAGLSRTRGGRITGDKIRDKAAAHDAKIRKYHRRWIMSSDDLSDEYRSEAAYIKHELQAKEDVRLPEKTIRARLTAINDSQKKDAR
jgi:hypothetical protein